MDYFDLRVVGGVNAVDAIPWQVSIRVNRFGKEDHWCGGTIIDQKTILTAAHCTRNVQIIDGYDNWSIIAGTRLRSGANGQVINTFITSILNINFIILKG